jgi:sporadic carbohydrate cluster protein (TIGR04323 family)
VGDDADIRGFRGYIASRPVNGVPYPHRVQNLVIRDYCQRKGLHYLLSAAETSIPNGFMILNDVLSEIGKLKGVVLFSLFTLPAKREERARIYDLVLANGASLHAAMEEIAIQRREDIVAFEDILRLASILADTPYGGRFPAGVDDTTVRALRA